VIRISMKGLAKFMTASDANKRKIIKDYKFPDPEGSAQATYYREARDFIEAYHKSNHPREWLQEKADNLRDLSSGASGTSRTRFQNNARALGQYAMHFARKKFTVLAEFRAPIVIENVYVTVVPDLYVQEGKLKKLIKLEFGKDEPDRDIPKIVCHMMYEAACKANLGMSGSQILYFDVPRGIIYKDARVRARMKTNIEAACKNIEAIWDGIQQ
jgi:hypothetical protein